MTDHTAVGVCVALNIGFHAARTRLKFLAQGGRLPEASEVAYGEGITGLAELAGPAARLTRLAGVCLEDLTETGDCEHMALQWEAIAADGKLFTALLADLILLPAGDQITALTVTGTYWPPPGRAGTGLEQAIVCRCATAVIGSFLDLVACELVHPADMTGSERNGVLRSADAAVPPVWPGDDRVMETASRGTEATLLLLAAARRLQPLNLQVARQTYLDAFSAAQFAARLSEGIDIAEVARTVRSAPRPPDDELMPGDLLLDAFVALTDDYVTAVPVGRNALTGLCRDPDSARENLR